MNYSTTLQIKQRLFDFSRPRRKALSTRYPGFKSLFISTKRALRHLENLCFYNLATNKASNNLSYIFARHQSLLLRKPGDSNPVLQQRKITNLKIAAKELDGILIKPGEEFSLWHILGKPTTRKGYVNGMLLSNGKVVEGLGGGLCQLSNLLFWLFLHTPLKIVERYHHSMDVFPDSGRVLPFGSGATVLYNFVDLKVRNTTNKVFQIKLHLTDKHLKGRVLCETSWPRKYHVYEKHHCLIKKDNQYYRYNELWRDTREADSVTESEKLYTNFAPVLYKVSADYILKNNFFLLDLNS